VLGSGHAFVNECGFKDVWPVIAEGLSSSYGASGRFGFGGNRVRDRFHAVGHSGFLTSEFVSKYWVPFFYGGTVVDGHLQPHQPSWLRLLSNSRYIGVAVFLALLIAIPGPRNRIKAAIDPLFFRQAVRITGVARDAFGHPVEGVTITAEGHNFFSSSGTSGDFVAELRPINRGESIRLRATKSGYQDWSKSISVTGTNVDLGIIQLEQVRR